MDHEANLHKNIMLKKFAFKNFVGYGQRHLMVICSTKEHQSADTCSILCIILFKVPQEKL